MTTRNLRTGVVAGPHFKRRVDFQQELANAPECIGFWDWDSKRVTLVTGGQISSIVNWRDGGPSLTPSSASTRQTLGYNDTLKRNVGVSVRRTDNTTPRMIVTGYAPPVEWPMGSARSLLALVRHTIAPIVAVPAEFHHVFGSFTTGKTLALHTLMSETGKPVVRAYSGPTNVQTEINPTDWNLFVMSAPAAGIVKLSVNGRPPSIVTSTSTQAWDSTAPFEIGRNTMGVNMQYAALGFFNGDIFQQSLNWRSVLDFGNAWGVV